MAEINLRTSALPEIDKASTEAKYRFFGNVLESLKQLHIKFFDVPEPEVSLTHQTYTAYGDTEPVQVNSRWTATEDWPIGKMGELAFLQIAAAAAVFPDSPVISSTVRQEGVIPAHNKTIFAMGQRLKDGSVTVDLEMPQLDAAGKVAQYRISTLALTPEEVSGFSTGLGLMTIGMFE